MTAAYYLSAPLVAADGGAASGRVEALFSALLRSLYVEAQGLAPDASYRLMLDEALVASFETDAAGSGSVSREVSDHSADPRGRTITVVDDAGAVVLVVAAGDPELVEIEHAPLAAFAAGGGSTNLRSIGGMRTLAVRLEGVEPGTYDVVVDGSPRAEIDAADGRGSALFDAADVGPGSWVEIQQGGVGFFANAPRAEILGLDWCLAGTAEQSFDTMSHLVGLDTHAVAALTTELDCGRRFDVTIADVPLGAYELWVGDAQRGTIMVGTDENGDAWGATSFWTDERGARELDFEPVGQSVEIRRGSGRFFWIESFQP